jgi:hypothetical protein
MCLFLNKFLIPFYTATLLQISSILLTREFLKIFLAVLGFEFKALKYFHQTEIFCNNWIRDKGLKPIRIGIMGCSKSGSVVPQFTEKWN